MPLAIINLPHRGRGRRGIVAVLLASVLTGLLGISAVALDGGLLQDNKRRVQAAADAAALAAAVTLYTNYELIISSGYLTFDPGSKAATAALTAASANGCPNDGTTATVTVNIPPKSGLFVKKTGYAEVIITYYQRRYFSTIWGSQNLPVVARAVARGNWGPTGNGIIVLDPTASNSLNAQGGGSMTVTGNAAVVVDSNNLTAATTGGGGTFTAPLFNITGDYSGTFNGTVQTGTPPIPDPLAYLPAPTQPAAGTMTKVHLPGGGTQYTFSPGYYSNLPNFTNGDQVIFQQASAGNNGIYYISGGFISNGASITMDPNTSGGVMLYLAPNGNGNSQVLSIQGNSAGTVNLSALTSGPYAGILFWQQRTATQQMSITGNGTFTLNGTFYAANANLSVTGNGTATIGSQYISRTLSLGGGGVTTVNYTDSGTGRQREIYLVE